MLTAKRRDCVDDPLPTQLAADDGVSAVDVSRDVFKACVGEFFAERLCGQLSFPADAAKEDEIDGALHQLAIVGLCVARFNPSAATPRRRAPWAIASDRSGK